MNRRFLKLMSAFAVGLALLGARTAKADTITLHDLSQDTVHGVYTYTIQFDNATDAHLGDGFVLYDFAGETGFTITGDLSTSQFSATETLTGNVLTQSNSVNANGNVAAISNSMAFDNAGVENISFVYDGPPTVFLGAATAVLTVFTDVLGSSTGSVYASVDHSGPNQDRPFSFSANPITVPAATAPLPASWLGSAGLMTVLGLIKARKAMCMA